MFFANVRLPVSLGHIAAFLHCGNLRVFVRGKFAVTPQILQLVKSPGLRVEYVDDRVKIIKANPFSYLTAVNGFWIFAQLSLEAVLNIVGDGRYLGNGLALTDDKKVSRPIVQLAQVNADDVLAFDILHSIYDDVEPLVDPFGSILRRDLDGSIQIFDLVKRIAASSMPLTTVFRCQWVTEMA